MRQHGQIAGRFFALGMVAIAGVVGILSSTALSQDPPPRVSERTAGGIAGQRTSRAPRDDSVTPAQGRPVELSPALVVRCKAATALVELHAVGSGSAVCVSTDGFFVTNHHVVADAGLGHDVRVVVHPGQNAQKVLNARVIKLDEENDLALLKVDASPDLVAIPLGTDVNLVETMSLAAFGYPFGRLLASDNRYPAVSVNAGTVTALRKKAGKLSSIQLDASVNPGNSGGPVVDKEGKLIGIVNSGIPGARLNFAIPVRLVREFLSGPALVLRDPGLTFPERSKTRQFEIDAYALDSHVLDAIAVELSLTGSADDTRTLTAKRIGSRFVASGPACSPAGAPSKPVLVVHKGRGQIKCALPPGDVSFGGRKFSWLAIDSLEKDGDVWVLSLLDNQRFAGQPRALPGMSYGAGRTTELATADRIEVRLENPPPTDVSYEIESHRGATVFAPIRGRLRIKDTPRGLVTSVGQPTDRMQIHEPIVIEGVVRETLIVGVAPTGLVWSPVQGAPSGMEDESGRYLLVNGQRWRAAAGPSVLPILLGIRDAQIQLLWARPVGDGPHSAERVSADVQKVPMANLTSMIVRNRAAEPTRVALAITFDPPKVIDPILPLRSRPVLESHWPLNDDEPARAADIGPAKCDGLTSVAHFVPGIRGNGLQIDRQAVVCADVLPIDRNDAFSCSAWMMPARAGNLTLLSRMNSGLRGFDLNYAGSLQAHLISSWDGSAIRVCTIERFDSSQWHHVAVTYDGSSRSRGWKIYLDGALATLQVTVDRLNDTIHSDFPFAIGARERRDYYQGRVDEVRNYNRALNDDEVFDLYDRERSNLDPAAGSTLTQGLVGHWSFDASPGESFKDKSGNGHDGKPEPDLGLPELVDSDGSQAVRLGGMGTLDCGAMANFDREAPYSLGAWIKPRGEGLRTVMSRFDVFERGFELAFDGHVICDLISEWEGSAILIKTRSVYPNDAWHHVICTYDGSSKSSGFAIYVDGALAPFDASHDQLTTSAKSRGDFRIGSRTGREYFNGDIDDAFVYGRALSAEEAQAWFMRGRTPVGALPTALTGGLVGFWTFEGDGREAFRDRSGHGHDAQSDLHAGHSAIVPRGKGRVARIRGVGGIDCGQAADFERTDAFSAGGWFCYEGGGQSSVLSKIEPSAPHRGYEIQYDGETFSAALIHNWDEPPGNFIAIQTAPIRGTGWRHVLFTYDGKSRATGLKLYVDGELQKVTVLKDNLSKSIRVDEPFIIGSRSTGLTMRGLASQVRVIPRELTAEEVGKLMTADRPPGPLP